MQLIQIATKINPASILTEKIPKSAILKQKIDVLYRFQFKKTGSSALFEKLSDLLKHVFSHSANRANPIIGNIFKSCSRSDSAIRIARCRVILVPARTAHIFTHTIPPFLYFSYDTAPGHIKKITPDNARFPAGTGKTPHKK